MVDHKKQGKKNLEAGRRFENKVRKDLEAKGWIVARWTNNVELPKYEMQEIIYIDGKKEKHPSKELKKGKCVQAKQGKFRKTSTGFPDFIAIQSTKNPVKWNVNGDNYIPALFNKELVNYSINIGVECKSNGYLTKEEREKCKWLLENNIFSKILIAKKGKKRGEIIYNEFKN